MKIINLGTTFLGSKREEKRFLIALDLQAKSRKIISDYKRGRI